MTEPPRRRVYFDANAISRTLQDEVWKAGLEGEYPRASTDYVMGWTGIIEASGTVRRDPELCTRIGHHIESLMNHAPIREYSVLLSLERERPVDDAALYMGSQETDQVRCYVRAMQRPEDPRSRKLMDAQLARIEGQGREFERWMTPMLDGLRSGKDRRRASGIRPKYGRPAEQYDVAKTGPSICRWVESQYGIRCDHAPDADIMDLRYRLHHKMMDCVLLMGASAVADIQPDEGQSVPPGLRYRVEGNNAFADAEHALLGGLVGVLLTDDRRLGYFAQNYLWRHQPAFQAARFEDRVSETGGAPRAARE